MTGPSTTPLMSSVNQDMVTLPRTTTEPLLAAHSPQLTESTDVQRKPGSTQDTPLERELSSAPSAGTSLSRKSSKQSLHAPHDEKRNIRRFLATIKPHPIRDRGRHKMRSRSSDDLHSTYSTCDPTTPLVSSSRHSSPSRRRKHHLYHLHHHGPSHASSQPVDEEASRLCDIFGHETGPTLADALRPWGANRITAPSGVVQCKRCGVMVEDLSEDDTDAEHSAGTDSAARNGGLGGNGQKGMSWYVTSPVPRRVAHHPLAPAPGPVTDPVATRDGTRSASGPAPSSHASPAPATPTPPLLDVSEATRVDAPKRVNRAVTFLRRKRSLPAIVTEKQVDYNTFEAERRASWFRRRLWYSSHTDAA